MQRDTIQQTFKVAILLSLVCSIAVSSLAVGLRDTQKLKKEQFRQENILRAAGLVTLDQDVTGEEISALFRKHVTPVVLDLKTNRVSQRYKPGAPELETEAALRDAELSEPVSEADGTGRDIAGIRRRETNVTLYEVREGDRLKTLVLPIRGYGLWSTLWGFLAVDFSDATTDPASLTVRGLTYYKHAETPGLGGEVDNPLWKAHWPGKHIYDSDGDVMLEVAKNASGDYEVDALSGATLTSNGVSNMIAYWMGENGYGAYLQSLLPAGNSADATVAGETAAGGESAASGDDVVTE